MNKRGALEVQLNWIFVLIIGVIIFSFFIVIANKQKESSDNRVAIIIKKNIDTFIKASEASTNSFKEVSIPETKLRFTCDSRGVSDFDVGDRGLKEDLSYDVLFSPETIKDNQLYFWTLDFEMPFKITSFLYMSSSKTKYVFIQDNEKFVDGLYNFMPEQFDKMLIKRGSEANLTPKNYDNYVFIIKTSSAEVPSLYLDRFSNYKGRLSTVNLVPVNEDRGIIRFYQGYLMEDSGQVPYLGDESIFGAIFSGSAANFKCNMKKAVTKLNMVSQIYFDRTLNLSNMHKETGDPCLYLYNYPEQSLNKIKSNSNPSIEFTNQSFTNILDAKDTLIKSNEALYLKPQCPSIY